MINPYSITNFNRTDYELQEFLLFCIVVAGKTAHIQADKLDYFLNDSKNALKSFYSDELLHNIKPFDIISLLNENNILLLQIIKAKLGQYNKIYKAFQCISNIKNKINLKECTTEELEKIPGVGLKTSRFFILHSRNTTSIAVLDVHILKFLKSLGHDVPKTTPNKKKYYFLEQKFLDYCRNENIHPAEADLDIWKSYARKQNKVAENV